MSICVCDCSAVVAMLLDSGFDGQWATDQLTGTNLAAPHLVAYESANIMRRHELTGLVAPDQVARRGRRNSRSPVRRRAPV